MPSLSPAQYNYLVDGEWSKQHDRTVAALVKRGLMTKEHTWPYRTERTAAGMEVVRTAMEKRQTYALTRVPEGTPVIRTDSELLSMLTPEGTEPRVDVYVYRGSVPMVVKNGNGQKPLALLDKMYMWEIEVGNRAGKFLKHVPIIGHKGSYSYVLKEDA